MSTRPGTPAPERLKLTSRSYPPLGEHKRTAFILSTAGREFGEIVAICNTPLTREVDRDLKNNFTIRRKFPDTKFVEILPPCNRDYPLCPEQLPHWFEDKGIDWVKSGYICDPPHVASVIQSVIDFIFMEKYQNGIPLANMFIGGIGQGGTVALGVVIACGVEPIRYVGIDAKFPFLSPTQSTVEITEAWNGEPLMSTYALAMKFRKHLNLTVSDPNHNDAPETKKSGGLMSLIHHARTETPEDVIHRNLALKVLAISGYKTHLGYCLTSNNTSVHDDQLFALLRSMMDNLDYMTEDDGSQASRGSLPFMPVHVNLQDVHWTPVHVPPTTPRPLDLAGALQGVANSDISLKPRLSRMQMIHLRRAVLDSLCRSNESANTDTALPRTSAMRKRPSLTTTGTSAVTDEGSEGDREKHQKDTKHQSDEASLRRREDIIARRREEIIARREKSAARREKAANGL